MIKNRLLYLGGLFTALIFHIFYFGWYSWYLLVLVLCLPWFVLLISLPSMLRMRLKLTLPEHCTAGDTTFLRAYTGKEKAAMPPYRLHLTVSNTSDGKRETYKTHQLNELEGKIALNTTHCGIFRCSARGSRVYDYLGLFGLPIRGAFDKELLVTPLPVPPDPMPNLTSFSTSRRRPKPGGGFAEEHELREYRQGDSLRDIHWKLSAKTDQMILREAQEPIQEQVLLTFDLPKTCAQRDGIFAQLLWLSQWLIMHETPHKICWIAPDTNQLQSVFIQSEEDIQPMMRRILSQPLPEKALTLSEAHWPGVSWHYHVLSEEVQS